MALSLRALRYVQSVLRHQSISAAAEELSVAPSAISTALNQVEETLGVSLATRARSKGVFPTPTGLMVLRRTEELLERFDFFLDEIADLQTSLGGNLRIGYNAPIGPAFLPTIVAHMLKNDHHVDFTLIEGDNNTIRQSLLAGRVDAILYVEDIPSPNIETVPLMFAPTYCVVPSGHQFARQSSVTTDEIIGEKLILLDRPAASDQYLALLRKTGKEPEIVATTNSTEMLRSLVSNSFGISLLNMKPGNVQPYGGGKVHCLPISDSQSGAQFSLGFSLGPRRRLLQLFIDECVEFFASPQAKELIV